MKKGFGLLVILTFILTGVSSYAYPGYLSSFNSIYKTGNTVLNTCGLCHINPNGGGPRNGYGTDYTNNGSSFSAIESLDSDGDGFSNIDEINARTFPGDASSHPASEACTYTYSDWGACQPDGTQSRTVISSSPDGCTGTPVLTQSCTYTPPVSQNVMPVPAGQQSFTYDPVDSPVLSSDPSQAEPVSVGPAATGGDTVSIQLQAQFSDPVSVSFGIYAPAIDDLDIYFMSPSNSMQPISQGILESITDGSSASGGSGTGSDDGGSESHESQGINQGTLNNFVLWKTSVSSLGENAGTIPVSDLPSGVYTLVLTVRPSNSGDSQGEDTRNSNYYRWTTYLVVK